MQWRGQFSSLGGFTDTEGMTYLLLGDSPGCEVTHTVVEAVLCHIVVGGQEVLKLEDSVWAEAVGNKHVYINNA